MNALQDWEKVLQDSRFDLPQERWDALEARLRQAIRQDLAAPAVEVAAPTWAESWTDLLDRLADWLAPAPARWALGGSFALALLAGALWLRPTSSAPVVAEAFRWEPGQVLTTADSTTWDWSEGRSTITLRQGSMRLEKDSAGQVAIRVDHGSATFQVEHRSPSESFHVAFGACRIEVVGTAFTISRDSLGASAKVLEGRVRFVGEGRDAYLDAGQELSCTRPSGAVAASVSPEPVAKPVVAAATVPAPSRPSAADLAWTDMEAACRGSVEGCTDARADFVRKHGNDPRAPAIAWAWGQTARDAGQPRDALFAWDVAARSHDRLGAKAVVAASELRLGDLSEAPRAAKDLDALIPRLEVGSTLWTRAWTLRREAARKLGQAAMVATADSLLAAPRAVSGER